MVATVLGALAGCGLPVVPAAAPSDPAEVVEITFATPTMARVRAGDTLATIATRLGVDAVDLMAWNALASDDLEDDQILIVWPPADRTPAPVVVRKPGPKPRVVASAAEPSEPAVADAESDTVAVAGEGQRLHVDRSSVLTSGVLGADVSGTSDVDFATAAEGLRRYDLPDQTNGLGSRGSLAGGGEADALVMAGRTPTQTGPAIPDVPVKPPSLPTPPAKKCLAGTVEEVGEDGSSIAVSRGLDAAQISSGIAPIQRYTPRCFPQGTEGSYTVVAEVVVGCDGRVADVEMVEAGVVPGQVASCIEQTLAHAAFPAHALPDGVTFQIPLRFSF